MRIVIGAAMLALVVSGASPVLAQVQPTQDRINTAIARARQVGVPVALLESKIAEGKPRAFHWIGSRSLSSGARRRWSVRARR